MNQEALMSDSPAMPCPVCRVPLVMSERQGVEIDYCPQCRGVWLDRGELDKIVERNAQESAPRAAQPAPDPNYSRGSDRGSDRGYSQPQHQHGGYPHKKRKSFLEELFD
ncbi:MAG: TFIIB-type zinc ribbon-containing protein [Allosphingosinicella sp.]